MKHINITFLLIVLMGMVSIKASAYVLADDGYYYNNYSDGTAFFQGGRGIAGHFTIPESMTYKGRKYYVIGIYASAFQNSSHLISVTIPSSIISIQKNAFYNCVFRDL